MDKYQIAANVTIAGIDGTYQTMTASEQRAIFGGYVFGKVLIHADASDQGKVTISKQAGHSNIAPDTIFATYTFQQVAEAVNAGRKLGIS